MQKTGNGLSKFVYWLRGKESGSSDPDLMVGRMAKQGKLMDTRVQDT